MLAVSLSCPHPNSEALCKELNTNQPTAAQLAALYVLHAWQAVTVRDEGRCFKERQASNYLTEQDKQRRKATAPAAAAAARKANSESSVQRYRLPLQQLRFDVASRLVPSGPALCSRVTSSWCWCQQACLWTAIKGPAQQDAADQASDTESHNWAGISCQQQQQTLKQTMQRSVDLTGPNRIAAKGVHSSSVQCHGQTPGRPRPWALLLSSIQHPFAACHWQQVLAQQANQLAQQRITAQVAQ